MSVSSTTRKQQVVLDGITSTATFTFRALTSAPTDIKCSVLTNSTTTVLTYTTDYTVEINSDGIGGTVTLVAPATTGLGTLTVYRETTNTQESDYDDYNQFPANTLEEDLDKLVMQIQEIIETFRRCAKLPIESIITDLDFPEPSAGKGLKWNLATTGLINTTYNADEEAVAAATSAATALAAQLAATTQSTLAGLYATTSSTHATSALAAQTAAELAETNAETAETNAETAETNAETAATNAENYVSTASTQATLSGLYASTASTGALTASTQALAAATSATTALSHSTTALTHATTALSHSTTALTASTTALSHSTTALTASTLALAYKNAAATSAAIALATTAILVNEVTDDYILALTDVNMLIDLNSAGAITLMVPSNSSVAIPTGSIIAIRQKGAGQVTITTDGTVTINSSDGLKTSAQYAVAALIKIDTNTWIATGSLEV